MAINDDKNTPTGAQPHNGSEAKPQDKQQDKSSDERPVSTIEIFVQGEGIPEMQLVKVPENIRVGEIIVALRAKGLSGEGDFAVMLEDEEAELPHEARLNDLKIGHRRRLHCHRCRRIQVSVTYNGTESRAFPPSTTIGRVKKWADKEFGLKGQDATDLVLQISGTTTKPDEDIHIGTLVKHPHCALRLDLVPKKFVQG